MTAAGRLLPLVLLNALLVFAVWRLAAAPVDIAPIPPERRALSGTAGRLPSEAALPRLADLERNQAITRPLFAPDRRAWQEPDAAPAAPEPVAPTLDAGPEEEPDFLLVGVAIGGGSGRALILDAANGGEPEWVGEGEALGDWVVAEVSPQSVRLERDGEAISLDLYPGGAQP